MFLFIYFWPCWVFVTAGAFLYWGERGLLSSCCAGFSGCRARAPGHLLISNCNICVQWLRMPSSRAVAHGLSCSAACAQWDPPRSGIKPTSPGLADGFFTTEPPARPRDSFFWLFCFLPPEYELYFLVSWYDFSLSVEYWAMCSCLADGISSYGSPVLSGLEAVRGRCGFQFVLTFTSCPGFFFPVFWSCWPTATSRTGRWTTFYRLLPQLPQLCKDSFL